MTLETQLRGLEQPARDARHPVDDVLRLDRPALGAERQRGLQHVALIGAEAGATFRVGRTVAVGHDDPRAAGQARVLLAVGAGLLLAAVGGDRHAALVGDAVEVLRRVLGHRGRVDVSRVEPDDVEVGAQQLLRRARQVGERRRAGEAPVDLGVHGLADPGPVEDLDADAVDRPVGQGPGGGQALGDTGPESLRMPRVHPGDVGRGRRIVLLAGLVDGEEPRDPERLLGPDAGAGQVREREVLVVDRRLAGTAGDPRLVAGEPRGDRWRRGRQPGGRRVDDVPLDRPRPALQAVADVVRYTGDAEDEVRTRGQAARAEVPRDLFDLRLLARDDPGDRDGNPRRRQERRPRLVTGAELRRDLLIAVGRHHDRRRQRLALFAGQVHAVHVRTGGTAQRLVQQPRRRHRAGRVGTGHLGHRRLKSSLDRLRVQRRANLPELLESRHPARAWHRTRVAAVSGWS